MNQHYEAAVKAVKGLNKQTGALWPSLVLFAVATVQGTDAKPAFKAEEKLASNDAKVKMGENSTYRVQKGIIVAAIAKGIKLVDADGKPRGKTDIEDELKEGKAPKSAIDKFKIAMNTAGALADQLAAHDRIMAAALVQDLLKAVSNGIALAA